MKKLIASLAAAALFIGAPAFAEPSEGAKYSVAKTTIGTLLADEAAAAILEAELPEVVNDSRITMAYSMTLPEAQPYAEGMITDEKLAAIDAQLAELE